MAARILVTGLSGFTGQHLRAALRAAGHAVLDPAELAGGKFDLTDPVLVERVVERAEPDYVIHLAAVSFVAHSEATAFYRVNTIGVCNLLDALCRAAPGVRRVVVASSANVYGNAAADPLDESVPPAPVNHYACSKLAMEHMARTYFDRLPIVITRPFNYTGPGQDVRFLVPKIVAHFASAAPAIELGNLDVVRDFSDVRMVVDAYARLLTAPAVGQAINICSGVGRSLRWIVEELTRIAGRGIEVRVDPSLIRPSDIARLVGDNARLSALIGPLRHTDFAETLRWMFSQQSMTLRSIAARA